VLRVFASSPGEAKLQRTDGEDPDSHPLATLHLENFDETCKELTRDWFLGTGQQLLVLPSKRAHEAQESESPVWKRARLGV